MLPNGLCSAQNLIGRRRASLYVSRPGDPHDDDHNCGQAIHLARARYHRAVWLLDCTAELRTAGFGKLWPAGWRSLAFGAGTAAGSFGRFLFSPLAVVLSDHLGWQAALPIFSVVMLLILPLSLALVTPAAAERPAGAVAPQSL